MLRILCISGLLIAHLWATPLDNNKSPDTPNLQELITLYTQYKEQRESEVEQKILKARVLNFAPYLYQGVLEMQFPQSDKVVAFTATLSLLAQEGKTLEIPDTYGHLKPLILEEAKLVLDAKEKRLSPILDVMVDYREFKVSTPYQTMPFYYKTIKFAQLIPLDIPISCENNQSVSTQIEATIKASERLTNLQHAIYNNLEYFVGIEKSDTDMKRLLLSSSKEPKQIYKELDSSYAYDQAIISLLGSHRELSKSYQEASQNRLSLYLPKGYPITTKKLISNPMKMILNIMIENSLCFALTITNNTQDKEMIKRLKSYRARVK